MKVVAFLPVKGSSDRIPNKNVSLLDGKELFLHTLQKLIKCDFIDEVYLDSESEEIFEMASEVRCKRLERNPTLASNETDGNTLFMNEIKNAEEADIYVQILCTSPFIEPDTIKKGIGAIKDTNEYDSAVLVRKEKMYLWDENGPKYNKEKIPNSVDLEDTIIETMGLYIIKKDAVAKTKRRIGDKPYLLEASPLEAIDVNFPEDFELAKLIRGGIRNKENKQLNLIKKHLSSTIFSDILDEMGIKGAIVGLKPNFKAKAFGRAKTLKLRRLKKGENYKGIYDALESYSYCGENDIIVVENELSDYAYFGELNANLATRAGASCAIIGGKTRDTTEVSDLNFPVFSTGSTCLDVKKRATVESINKKIVIEGVEIYPDNLVFADSDGIVVIPKEKEDIIIKKALETVTSERKISTDILKGLSVKEIIDRSGFF